MLLAEISASTGPGVACRATASRAGRRPRIFPRELSIRHLLVRRQCAQPPGPGGDDLKETIMYTLTTQLADCLHGERLREADRARLAVSARAASRPARRACPG